MIKNYLKTAWRNLINQKVFSLINIAGLSLGLMVFILIALWVKNELSYDGFHKDKERIGLVMVNQTYKGNDKASFPATSSLLAKVMKNDLPGVEYASTVSWGDVRLFTNGDKSFSEYGLYVEPDFLKIFNFPLLNGNAERVLIEPNTVLLNESLAKKYFGNEDPVGKTIVIENATPYKVEGVFKDIPENSSLKPDFLMPAKDYINWAMGGVESWESNNMKTYVKLKAGVDRNKFDESFKKFQNNYTEEKNGNELFLWDLKDWYLRFDFKNGKYAGGGRIVYVKLFIIIAVFILLLACINFMNLSTARATQRAKEVGVRKVIGAGKRSLIFQFIGESILLASIAAIISVIAVSFVLPFFNNFLNKQLSIDYTDPVYISVFLGIILITGLLAGSYPALVLSSFKPVKILKGTASGGMNNSLWIRKILVVTQFTVSILLIVGTLVVHRQINFIKNKNLGYNREHLLWFPNTIAQDIGDRGIQEFKKVPGVLQVARGSMTFTAPNNRDTEVKWPGKETGEEIFFNFITSDHQIIQTMGIEMKEGRPFSEEFVSDTSAYILNEEAVKRMGLKNPVGQVIETRAGKGAIVGVAKDFHFESMHNPIGPVIIQCRPQWTWLIYVRTDGKNMQQTINGLEDVYKSIAPGYVFSYNFQDAEFERLFKSELQISRLVNWFAFLAIFISGLGLLGLTIFTVNRRTKEIGIRKVIGAGTFQIVSLISRQFIMLVLLALIISIVPAWYFMNSWLENYSYRTNIHWTLFLLAGGIAILIAIITISFQAFRAALTNPVKSLRTE